MTATDQKNELTALEQIFAEAPDRRGYGELQGVVLDTVGVAIAGSSAPVTAAVLAGLGAPTTPWHEAYLNAVAGHAEDFDDTHAASLCHTGAVLVPGLLALGRARALPGSSLLDALGVGIGVASWLGEIGPALNGSGFHSSGFVGAMAGAVACSHLLGLSADRARDALHFAAVSASGLCVSFGTDTKPLQVGHSAETAVRAALLIAAGASTPPGGLSGPGGLLSLTIARTAPTSTGAYPSRPAEAVAVKAYPCCHLVHAAIDAARELRERCGPLELGAEPLPPIEITVNPLVTKLADKTELRTNLDAKFSLRFCVLATLLDGPPVLETFELAAVRALLGRLEAAGSHLEAITVRESPELPELAARLRLGAGEREQAAECLAPRGVPARPMSQAEIAEKFRSISLPRRGEGPTASTEERVGALASASDLSAVGPLLPFEGAR